MLESELHMQVVVTEYDPLWPALYRQESSRLLVECSQHFVALEHVGSTAVPGLAAKPVIDMMAAIADIERCAELLEILGRFGYVEVATGMKRRIFLQYIQAGTGQQFNLHLVEVAGWEAQKERFLRDYLISSQPARERYARLKWQLAQLYADDVLGYTKAKTPFLQEASDRVRKLLGLPPIDVWNE